jgi:hypothetical protein
LLWSVVEDPMRIPMLALWLSVCLSTGSLAGAAKPLKLDAFRKQPAPGSMHARELEWDRDGSGGYHGLSRFISPLKDNGRRLQIRQSRGRFQFVGPEGTPVGRRYDTLEPVGHGLMKGTRGVSRFLVDPRTGTEVIANDGPLVKLEGTNLLLSQDGIGGRQVFDLKGKDFVPVRQGKGSRSFTVLPVRRGTGTFDVDFHVQVTGKDGKVREFDEEGKRVR